MNPPRRFRRVVAICLALPALTFFDHAVRLKADTTDANQQPPSSSDASAVLAAAREALGGEKHLSSLKTLTTTGRTRQVQGDNLVPIEFEINIEFPDKYARTDEIPAKESGPTRRGFNGDALIQWPEPDAPARGGARGAPPAAPPAREGGPAPADGRGRGGRGGAPMDPVTTAKQDFVRLTLGMFATSYSAYPLTFALVGQAEAPEGKADVLEVKGPGTFAGRLFIDQKTRLPLMFSWNTPANLVPVAAGQTPPANLPPGSVTFEVKAAAPGPNAAQEERTKFQEEVAAARKAAMATARPTEHRIYYADYRDVDGLKLPFRIRRAVGATTTEETIFDRYRINPKIDPRRFEARK